MTDITYFDGDYYDGKYHTVIKPVTVGVSDYFESGYIDEGYYSTSTPSSFNLTADAFTFVSKWYGSNRPIDWDDSNASNVSFDSTIKKYGTHSVKIPGASGSTQWIESDPLHANNIAPPDSNSWVFEAWIYYNETDADNNTFISYGSTVHSTNDTILVPGQGFVIQERNKRIVINVEAYNTWPTSRTQIELYNASSAQMANGNWYKISLIYDANTTTYKSYIGSTLLDSQTLSVTQDPMYLQINRKLFLIEDGFSSFDRYYDSLAFKYGTTTLDSTTSEFTNTLDHLVLSKFDNSFADDLSVDLNAESTLGTTVSLTASADNIINVDSILSGVSNISSAISIDYAITANLSGIFTPTIEADIVISGSTNISSNFNINVEVSKATTITLNNLDTVASINANGSRDRSVSAEFTGVFSPVIDALLQKATDITCQSFASLTCIAGIQETAEAELAIQSLIESSLIKVTPVESILNSNVQLTSTSTRIFSNESNLSSEFNTLFTVFNFASTQSTIDAIFTTNINAVKTVTVDSNLDTVSNLISSITANVIIASNLLAAFTQSSDSFIINLTDIVYTIPDENKTFTLDSETRTHNLLHEIRLLNIDVETRTKDIEEEIRTFNVEGIE